MQSQYKYFSRATQVDFKMYLEEQKSKYSGIPDKEVCAGGGRSEELTVFCCTGIKTYYKLIIKRFDTGILIGTQKSGTNSKTRRTTSCT